MSLTPGTRLGVYEVVGALGAGAMGEVYKARDSRLHRLVAIKVLPAGPLDTQLRFLQEARAASALNHPSIVTIYDVGEEQALRYIAMELVEGHTVDQLIANGPLRLDDVLRWSVQAADGLSKAHA